MSVSSFFTLDPTGLDFLSDAWARDTARFGATPAARDALFAELAARYAEPGRVYHTFAHVKALLVLLGEFERAIEDPPAVRFAVWYHDAVYDTHRGDNEERSADLATRALAALGAPPDLAPKVEAFVRATKTHDATDLGPDGGLFLDADLGILGAGERVYREYSAAIRAEYGWVPRFLYRRKRKQVLRSLAERPRLYFTDAMAERFEAAARRNLLAEIRELGG